jgi:hypothetical protein
MRKCSPAALFTIAMVMYVLFACTDFISMHIERRAAMTAPFFPQDTDYVARYSYRNLGYAFLMAIFAVPIWVQTRFGALLYPRTTMLLFWLLHISLLSNAALPSLIRPFLPYPRRSLDYLDIMSVYTRITSFAVVFSSIAIISLCGLLILSFFQAWRRS